MSKNSIENIFKLIVTANSRGNYSTAAKKSHELAKILPDSPEVYFNLSIALQGLNQKEKACEALNKAASLSSNNPEALNAIGFKFIELNELERAEHCLIRAITLTPNYSFAYSNLGILKEKQKCFKEAEQYFRKSIQSQPDLAPAYANLGGILNAQGQFNSAEMACRKAINLDEKLHIAWKNLEIALHKLGRTNESMECISKAYSLAPSSDYLLGDFINSKLGICDWTTFKQDYETLIHRTQQDQKAVLPFYALRLIPDQAIHQQISRNWVTNECPERSDLGLIETSPIKKDKITIGYFSADYHNHATAYLMAELFEIHDRSKFNLIGISFGPNTNDEMRVRIENAFDQFIDVQDKSEKAIAQLSRELSIDVAVDLKGHTEMGRTGIFAYRAAPIQINYLGYPGTMGASYMDYIIADKTVIPEGSQKYYEEKIIYLPDSYQVNDSKREISNMMLSKQDHGLPENAFVFCCFNNSYKILPETFKSWMHILGSVKDSVLWLLSGNEIIKRNLAKEAAAHGIDPTRLIFAEPLPLSEHLARHRLADLFLDTLPYNAHTTTSDSLWAGLPVLTLRGDAFAGRVSASLLNAIRLPELITDSVQEFEQKAIKLATSPESLAAIRQKLDSHRLTTPLFDTELFCKNIEDAYIQAYKRYQNDLVTEHIYITN